jgi:hypothetical protein
MTSAAARALRGLAGALTVATIAGCVAPIAPGEPRAVNGLTILPYETHRECARLRAGDRLEYTFETTEPVGFEIRYFEGSAAVSPIVRENTRADAGVFVAADSRQFCLVWEARGAGTLIDYRVWLRPASP